jgi:hypothetical protein
VKGDSRGATSRRGGDFMHRKRGALAAVFLFDCLLVRLFSTIVKPASSMSSSLLTDGVTLPVCFTPNEGLVEGSRTALLVLGAAAAT